MLRALLCVASAHALAPPPVHLGDFVLQRAIQTQLHYSAGLRNEPQVGWMAKFEGHEHLDSVGRHVGASGFPGTYTAAFGQLRTTPYTAYLAALGEEPDGIVEVELAPPPQRLSSREQANPFLRNRVQKSMFYDEPIHTRAILARVLDTAEALVKTWSFHLDLLEKGDAQRVASDHAAVGALPTPQMSRDALLAEGGETAYTRDDQMPLYAYDRRAMDRLTTLRALAALYDCLLYTSPSPRDKRQSRMPSSA